MAKEDKKIMVRKSTGQLVPFDEDRVKGTLKRGGANDEQIEHILGVVKSKLRPKMTTGEILEIIKQELKKINPGAEARYQLRSALLRMGPAGFHFEKYVASILEAYGYETKLPDELEGACVTHEVDVIAEKDGRRMFIEAKFRNNFQDTVNIKDTMSTWSRYLDLVDGGKLGLCPHFDEAWIVTNARFTDHSLKYGHCKNMVMIGWNHPRERTFARMVDLVQLYPTTIIEELKDKEMEALMKEEVTLCRELAKKNAVSLSKKTGIARKRIAELQKQCKVVMMTDQSNQK